MRKTKNFKIDGYEKSFEVKELKMREIISLMQDDTLVGDMDLASFKEQFKTRLLPLCSNIEMSDLTEMTPSEIKVIWEAFRGVNSDFFELARGAGIDKILMKLKETIIADFSNFVVDSSSQDTSKS